MENHVSLNDWTTDISLSLIYQGANVVVAGEDIRVISRRHCSVEIKWIDNHLFDDIGNRTVSGLFQNPDGTVIAIMRQYAPLQPRASPIYLGS
jgi:hypothetical protein